LRWVVTGSGGQLGQCLVEAIHSDAREVLAAAFSRDQLDISDARAVSSLFERVPGTVDVLINAAAFTAVDRCETETDRAFAVNGVGPGLLAEACAKADVGLVHVSTDYVFDGTASAPCGEETPVAPQGEYGRSKAEGERRVLSRLPESIVVRTSWVFGPGRNFVVAILDQAARRRRGELTGPLKVVDDQRGTPTYAADLARGLIELARLSFRGAHANRHDSSDTGPPLRGLVHLTNSGETTWWEFARVILSETGHADLQVDPISTADLGLPAPRPAYSVLDCTRAASVGVSLRSWREALVDYLRTPAIRRTWETAS
jgi:dTDP-4-dehydrorhamnose reductase